MDLPGQLSNRDLQGSWARLAARLEGLRDWYPAPRSTGPARRVRRRGEVREIITGLLAVEVSMRARDIHRAVERELGEEVSWSSIANCLRDNCAGPQPRLERTGYGRYRLR